MRHRVQQRSSRNFKREARVRALVAEYTDYNERLRDALVDAKELVASTDLLVDLLGHEALAW